MKSKYKVVKDQFSDYDLFCCKKPIAFGMRKSTAYKIKKALEIIGNADRYDACYECVHELKHTNEDPCKCCKTQLEMKIRSHFQPKEKK